MVLENSLEAPGTLLSAYSHFWRIMALLHFCIPNVYEFPSLAFLIGYLDHVEKGICEVRN